MNSTLNKILMFTAGAAIGSVVTWKLVKTKYEQLIQEEIDSVKEVYSKKYEGIEAGVVECEEPEEYGRVSAMVSAVTGVEIIPCDTEAEKELKNIISNYVSESDDTRKEADCDMTIPYVISPGEFADSDYEAVSLWYFEDGVLTDECYNIIEDVDGLVGEESLEHFGEYVDDPDTVYVRNDYLETDYEICRDERNYSEID